MVDAETIRRRLRKLDALVQRLRRYHAMDVHAFEADETAQAACERLLQVAIQLVLDIGAHILSERGVLDWEEYRDIPRRLAAAGVLPAELGERLARAAGLRNVLVHMYLDVDPALVHDAIRNQLDAFGAFAEHVLRELEGT